MSNWTILQNPRLCSVTKYFYYFFLQHLYTESIIHPAMAVDVQCSD